MAVMLQKMYRALTSAGADSNAAEAATVEMGSLFTKMTRIEVVLGFVAALQIAIFVKLFTSSGG